MIEIRKSNIEGAGRGIFATTVIKEGTIIESCPILLLPEKDYPLAKQTVLRNYYFLWKNSAAICLGYGSLYNHSYEPNATYKKDLEKEQISFIALQDIQSGEEITVNYNYGNPDDKSKLWIQDIK